MTFKEKLLMDYPENVLQDIYCFGCPSQYGYEDKKKYFEHCIYLNCCEECWEREMEE